MGKVLGLRKKPSGCQACYHLGHFALAHVVPHEDHKGERCPPLFARGGLPDAYITGRWTRDHPGQVLEKAAATCE